MKWGGILFMVIGVFIGINQVKKAYQDLQYRWNTVVATGTIVKVDSNLGEDISWKARKVVLYVQFQYSSDSVAVVSEACLSGHQAGFNDYSCGEVGAQRMVRYIPSENLSSLNESGFYQITDHGDYYSNSFSWFGLMIPLIMSLLGFVFYKVSDFVKSNKEDELNG
ncbi:hypothetical protein N7E81_09215 [Reichenbachiella carrageenanivorans]|uniref:DUF3592 domain-containing protein n=1 Tax=Reichenbachiella carrageenanivorans TaxID=2979869 RepID=A0ABY6D7Y7_9BACT|nr:hypothetical protein [Reichenbachiella carrageenanivorans]UXX81273.1 hypothetical protein N7E81_09215 [Reichenbachiella carrageenanivorans]